MKKGSILLLTAVCLISFVSPLFSAEKSRKISKDMTKEELISEIKESLEDEDELLEVMPGIKKLKDASGTAYYEINGTRLEKMDREALRGLFNRVSNEMNKIRTDRINNQLETIRQAQQATAAAQQASKGAYSAPQLPPAVPNIPKVYQPPQIPKTPTAPPPAAQRR